MEPPLPGTAVRKRAIEATGSPALRERTTMAAHGHAATSVQQTLTRDSIRGVLCGLLLGDALERPSLVRGR